MTARIQRVLIGLTMTAGLMLAPMWASGFDAGSDGSDGAFNPTADVEVSPALALDPDGDSVYHHTTVNIPPGVTVTYRRNASNAPIVIRAQGEVIIDGTINVSGQNGGSGETGVISSFAGLIPGGPGGFPGGRGGVGGAATPAEMAGGNGLGPGGGKGAPTAGCGGAGAGFGFAAASVTANCNGNSGGSIYGSTGLLPLIGGSGGGGGGGNANGNPGGAGGGGGGAILIASSGTVTINGSVVADGGNGGDYSTNVGAGGGGGGSGGAIRIVATAIAGNGSISAIGGQLGDGASNFTVNDNGTAGGKGRIRLEADEPIAFSGSVDPFPSVGQPQTLIVPNLPSIRMTQIAGEPVPTIPSGSDDIVLPSTTSNPVTVVLASQNVPLGRTINLTVVPDTGASFTVVSTPLTGTLATATATATVSLPSGHSVLSATVSFTVTAALGDAMKHFAGGERVERVTLVAGLGKASQTTFVTGTGREYTWPSNIIAAN